MPRINKSALTKIEIIKVASKRFLEDGVSATTAKAICNDLEMSTGNLTFHFPTKDSLLAVLVDMLCRFQWKTVKKEVEDGIDSVMALCLEVATMAVICEENPVAKDFYLSAYLSPYALDIIRENDLKRAKNIFADSCAHWDDEQFAVAETLVSGIEFATLLSTPASPPLNARIKGAAEAIMSIYGVPPEIRDSNLTKLFSMDFRKIARDTFSDFKKFVAQVNDESFDKLINGIDD